MLRSLVGSEMCIRDRSYAARAPLAGKIESRHTPTSGTRRQIQQKSHEPTTARLVITLLNARFKAQPTDAFDARRDCYRTRRRSAFRPRSIDALAGNLLLAHETRTGTSGPRTAGGANNRAKFFVGNLAVTRHLSLHKALSWKTSNRLGRK